MINYLIIDKCPGSGITGKIVRLINFISNKVKNIDDISNIYVKSEVLPTMNVIFEPCSKNPDISITLSLENQHLTNNINLKNIFENPDFVKLSKIAKLIRFNMSIITPLLINKEEKKLYDLGIHIRLTDMNMCHGPQYGNVNYEDYIKILLDVLSKNKINNIFLASDNFESRASTTKLLLDYGFTSDNIYYNNNMLLSNKQDNESFFKEQILNFTNINSFIEVLNDIFNLSISKRIIYRTSNVSNLAILLSSTLTCENVILIQ